MKVKLQNGLNLELDEKSQTAIVVESHEVSGVIFIPRFVEHDNKNYKITSIGRQAFAYETSSSTTLTFSEDSEVTSFAEQSFFVSTIRKIQIPPKLRILEDGWRIPNQFATPLEFEVSPKNKWFKIIDNNFLVGKSQEDKDVFDVLHYTRYDIVDALIPAEIKIVKQYSLSHHPKLRTIIFPENSELRTIEKSAFEESPIKKLVLSAKVENICPFFYVNYLKEIEISPKNKTFKFIDNKILLKKSDISSETYDILIFAVRDIEYVKINSKIKEIYSSSFFYCTQLKAVEFDPNSSLEVINNNSFARTKITNIIIPPSLKRVCNYSFTLNAFLTTITFLSEYILLEKPFLTHCSMIKKISFPNAKRIEFIEIRSGYCQVMEVHPNEVEIEVRKDVKFIHGNFSNCDVKIVYIDKNVDNQSKSEILLLKEENNKLKEDINRIEAENEKLKDETDQIKLENDQIKCENDRIKREKDSLNKKLQNQVDKNTKPTSNPSSINLQILDCKAVDDLNVVKTIGRGAQSEVFVVIKDQKLALKVLYIQGSKNETNKEDKNFKKLKNLLQEYEILQLLNHKNIIRAFGFCFGDKKHSPSILLEFCPNNLNDYVESMEDYEKVCAIFEIALGMEAIHAANIIHRDLKPENILIDENGHMKVSDFGISCYVDVENQTQSKTAGVGTLKFMAPELLNESTHYTNKVDVYSFGVVVFFILTGKLPKISVIEQGNGKKATIPKNINKISRKLIMDCWSTDPVDRPSFSDIINIIKSSNFILIDGVESQLNDIKSFLSL